MFTTFINDCRDDNARSRQESRVGALLKTSLSFIGVDSDLEASMHLLDILDATGGQEGVILVNVAHRGDHKKHFENGTPFAYFWYHKTLVVSSIDGYALSAVKRLGLVSEVNLLDIHESSELMFKNGFINETTAKYIPTSQFRSFDFIPRVGVYMIQGNHLPSTPFSLSAVPDLPPAIWHIDNFGNAKTTLTPDMIKTDTKTQTRYGELTYYPNLHRVPSRETALVLGSSGLNNLRFVEVLSQNQNFARHTNAKIGDDIFRDKSYFRTATE